MGEETTNLLAFQTTACAQEAGHASKCLPESGLSLLTVYSHTMMAADQCCGLPDLWTMRQECRKLRPRAASSAMRRPPARQSTAARSDGSLSSCCRLPPAQYLRRQGGRQEFTFQRSIVYMLVTTAQARVMPINVQPVHGDVSKAPW